MAPPISRLRYSFVNAIIVTLYDTRIVCAYYNSVQFNTCHSFVSLWAVSLIISDVIIVLD